MLSNLFMVGAIVCMVYMTNLCLKNDVHINGKHFDAVMVRILDVARKTAPPLSDETVWVTSANDSKHMKGSLHFENRAFDIRIKNIAGIKVFPHAARIWAEQMQIALGDDYDVVLERDHIHVEFQPEEE